MAKMRFFNKILGAVFPHFCPDKREIWHGERIIPNWVTCLHNLYEILRFYTRPQEAFKFLIWSLSGDKQPSYKHFPAVAAFSLKISIVPSGETIARIKKVSGVQKWYGPPLSLCQVYWGSWVARQLQ